MSMILHDEAYYKSRVPETDLGPLENFVRFIWNPERKTVLGRTGKEWGNYLNIFPKLKMLVKNFLIALSNRFVTTLLYLFLHCVGIHFRDSDVDQYSLYFEIEATVF